MLGLAALPTAPIGRAAFVFGFTALFGLGETVLAPTTGPLVNSLTDNTIRGRGQLARRPLPVPGIHWLTGLLASVFEPRSDGRLPPESLCGAAKI